MVVHPNLFAPHRFQQVFLLFPELFQGVLGLELEGGVGLGDKAGHADGHLHPPALGLFRHVVKEVYHLLGQVQHGLHILHRLGGQTHHKIELHGGTAPGEGGAGGGKHLLLGDIFIDGVPQALASCLRGEGKAASADLLHQLQKAGGEVIHPQGGQGDVHLFLLGPGEHLLHQQLQPAVVAGGKGGEGHLLVAGGGAEGPGLSVQHLRVLFPEGPVDIPRLAEPAAPDAAPEHLHHGPVVDRLGEGHHEIIREVHGG